MNDFLYHWLTCRIKRYWYRRKYHMPYWREDKIAKMLGIAQYGCSRCGRNAATERERKA